MFAQPAMPGAGLGLSGPSVGPRAGYRPARHRTARRRSVIEVELALCLFIQLPPLVLISHYRELCGVPDDNQGRDERAGDHEHCNGGVHDSGTLRPRPRKRATALSNAAEMWLKVRVCSPCSRRLAGTRDRQSNATTSYLSASVEADISWSTFARSTDSSKGPTPWMMTMSRLPATARQNRSGEEQPHPPSVGAWRRRFSRQIRGLVGDC